MKMYTGKYSKRTTKRLEKEYIPVLVTVTGYEHTSKKRTFRRAHEALEYAREWAQAANRLSATA